MGGDAGQTEGQIPEKRMARRGQTLCGGRQANYEKEAKILYGLLREAWERAVEEVLLDGIVERFRPSVQTQHLGTIADITDEDCQRVDTAMTKCSKWLHGHVSRSGARAGA